MQHIEPRVLLVEDDVAEARLLCDVVGGLAVRPIVFDHVTRVSQARERIERGGIAVIVLDLGLPDAWGVETIIALDEIRHGLPVIVISGHIDQRIRDVAATHGVVHIATKDDLACPRLVRLLERSLAASRAPLLLSDDADAMATSTREIAGRIHRVRAALEFSLGRLNNLSHTRDWMPPPELVRTGVQRRRARASVELGRSVLAQSARALEAAQVELDRMGELIVDVHRDLLRRGVARG